MPLGNELKLKAKSAKQRLKSGFWNNVNRKRQAEILEAQNNGKNVQKVKDYYSSYIIESIKAKDSFQAEEDLFLQKVREIIENEEYINNPLKLLMNDEYLESLDYGGKQRYILEISEKYRKAREKIELEKALVQ
ncbi:MAG: hypothetical protein FWG51_01845 [Firmicutes bacterium]|nr:hypothetical protein [Bacillota bacterium]